MHTYTRMNTFVRKKTQTHRQKHKRARAFMERESVCARVQMFARAFMERERESEGERETGSDLSSCVCVCVHVCVCV